MEVIFFAEIYPVDRGIHLLYNWGHVLPEKRFHIQQNKYCIIFYSCEGHIFAAMCSLGGGGGMGGGWVYFLQLYVDLDGNHKNFKNHQNEKPQGKI